jgi:hypothetical protein
LPLLAPFLLSVTLLYCLKLGVQYTVDALLLGFSGLQSSSISAFFFHFYCSVGRGSQALPITV